MTTGEKSGDKPLGEGVTWQGHTCRISSGGMAGWGRAKLRPLSLSTGRPGTPHLHSLHQLLLVASC